MQKQRKKKMKRKNEKREAKHVQFVPQALVSSKAYPLHLSAVFVIVKVHNMVRFVVGVESRGLVDAPVKAFNLPMNARVCSIQQMSVCPLFHSARNGQCPPYLLGMPMARRKESWRAANTQHCPYLTGAWSVELFCHASRMSRVDSQSVGCLYAPSKLPLQRPSRIPK